jgi:predicted RNase H-like nuclease (RuvC/YqgF family)
MRRKAMVMVLLLLLSACGENPKLVEKRDRQKMEIERLGSELALIDDKISKLPPDVTAELSKARKIAEEQVAQISRLEAELSESLERARILQENFDAYRAKYKTN